MQTLTWQKLPAAALQDNNILRQEWDRLSACRLDLPFMSAAAVAAALAVFADGTEQLFVARRGTAVVAMLLLVSEGRLRWRTFQPSQLPLGAWVAEAGLPLRNICRSLLRGPVGLCLALSITQVDPLQAAREADEDDDLSNDYIDTGWIDVQGSFDAYWAARGKNLRQNLRKQRNKLAADGTTTTLRVEYAADAMASAVARYGALESRGWKADQGTAIAPGNPQGRFYTRLLEEAAQQGQAAVFEYLFNGQTAAINLCLQRAGTLVVLKTTYDESIPKTLSPASLLREEELQHIFGGATVQRIEYYGRLMEWHTKLSDNKRTLYHLTVYRWPWVKRLALRRRTAAANVMPPPLTAEHAP